HHAVAGRGTSHDIASGPAKRPRLRAPRRPGTRPAGSPTLPEGRGPMQTQPASRDDITAIIGSVEDDVAIEILAVGASPDELTEARAWVANDEAMLNAGRPLPTGRTAEIADILRRLEIEALPDEG
ncbi:MAG: hypothetical protein WD096_11330, partial [Actinomycetota bacterium]